MKKLPILLPFILLSIGCTQSKRISFLDMEQLNINPQPVDLEYYEEKYGEYDGVYLNYESTIEHSGVKDPMPYRIGEKWTYTCVSTEKYIILNPEADWLTTYTMTFDPDTLFIRITSPDGISKRFGQEDLQVEEDENGYKTYKFVYPNVVKGTIVEVAYEDEFKIHPTIGYLFLDHGVLLQRYIPCEHLKFTFAYPDWWQVKTKRIGDKRDVPYTRNHLIENKKCTIVYEKTDVPAFLPEPYCPFRKEAAVYLELMITDFAMGSGSYKHVASWQELAKRFQKYALKKSGKRSKSMEKIVRGIVENMKFPYDRLDAIIDYIYENIEVGDNQDANHSKILDKKEGDSYDITSLAQAMLKEAGLTAEYLLVHSAYDGYFDREYLASNQLSIPALRVPIDSVDYVIFPYYKDLPIAHTPEYFQCEMALVVTEDPSSSYFWQLPPGNKADNAVDENYTLTIDDQGTIIVTENRVFRGAEAYSMRKAFEDLKESELDDAIKEMLTYTTGDLEIDFYDIRNQDKYKEPLEIEIKYSIDNLVIVTPEEIIFQTGGLLSPISNKQVKLEKEGRLNPIKIAYDERHDKYVTINFPDNWEISTILNDHQQENKFGQLIRTFESSPGQLRMHQRLDLNKILAPKVDIGLLVEIAGRSSELNLPTIIFKVNEEETVGFLGIER